MLVTKALNELKLLDSRITDEIVGSSFVVATKQSEKNINPGYTKDDFKKDAIASFDSINDLIARREKIKAAIVESNAHTTVEIGGITYTVAQAIDTKHSIAYRKKLLSAMTSQYTTALTKMEKANEKVQANIDRLIETAYGKESKNIKETDYETIARPYRESNEVALVDPLNVYDRMQEMRIFIQTFESEVDSVLQVSNCTTVIDV